MKIPKLRRFRIVGLLLVGLLAATACSNSKKEDEAYKHSKALPPLEVPPDLIKPSQDAGSAIPELPPAAQRPATPAAPSAPPVTEVAAAAPGAIHIEKQGALRWLVVPSAPPQTQQRVKDFLLQKGFSFAKEEAGTLETEWSGGEDKAADASDLDAALKGGLRDKFKLRIEAGRVDGTSEVSVSHLGLQRVMADGKPQWQPRAADSLLEAELLDQLRTFLEGEGTAVQPVSDLPAVKAKVTADTQGISTLKLNEDFEQAWRRVGIALGRGGFVVADRNRSEGIYLIRLGRAFKEDTKAGFVSRLFGSNADPDDSYRIAVQGRSGETLVTVQHPGGGPVHTGIGERILDKLKENME